MSSQTQQESSFVFRKYVGTVKAKPQAVQRFSLGNYSPDHPAKGFSIELKGENEAVTTDIVTSGSPKRYELMLHITNNSSKPVSAVVWQM
jgi:hypothetical protein